LPHGRDGLITNRTTDDIRCDVGHIQPVVAACKQQTFQSTISINATIVCHLDDDDDDEGRINFSVALSPKITRTHNNKPKQ